MTREDSRYAVSVIIPVHNRRVLLERALASLTRQEFDSFEVLVIDDRSDEPMAEAVAASGLGSARLITSTGVGAGAARNLGVEMATGRWIVFLDSDDEADPDWLSTLHRLGEESGAEIVFCGARRMRGDLFLNELLPSAASHGDAPTLFLAGTFMLRRQAFTAVGGYDTSLPSSQHTDLGLRLLDDRPGAAPSQAATRAMLLTIHVQDGGNIRSDHGAVVRGARLMIDKHSRRLAPSVLAEYHAVAGVHLVRSGARIADARAHFLSAVRADPGTRQHWGRLLVSCVPAVARRFWRR